MKRSKFNPQLLRPGVKLNVRDGMTISADQPFLVFAVRASQMPSQSSEALSDLEINPSTRAPAALIWKKPAPPVKGHQVAGVTYQLVHVCKNHDCADNNLLFLYSAEQNVLYGLVYQKGRTTLVGAPPPAVASELPKLWKKEWRQQ